MQQMRPGRRALAIACVAATAGAAGAIAGCGDDGTAGSAAKSTTFVGRIGHSKALVGIVTRGDTVRAYVCDGRRTGVWFDGRSSDGAIDLQARGAHLTADVGTGSVRGSVTLAGGQAMAFEAVRHEDDHVVAVGAVVEGDRRREPRDHADPDPRQHDRPVPDPHLARGRAGGLER